MGWRARQSGKQTDSLNKRQAERVDSGQRKANGRNQFIFEWSFNVHKFSPLLKMNVFFSQNEIYDVENPLPHFYYILLFSSSLLIQ